MKNNILLFIICCTLNVYLNAQAFKIDYSSANADNKFYVDPINSNAVEQDSMLKHIIVAF